MGRFQRGGSRGGTPQRGGRGNISNGSGGGRGGTPNSAPTRFNRGGGGFRGGMNKFRGGGSPRGGGGGGFTPRGGRDGFSPRGGGGFRGNRGGFRGGRGRGGGGSFNNTPQLNGKKKFDKDAEEESDEEASDNEEAEMDSETEQKVSKSTPKLNVKKQKTTEEEEDDDDEDEDDDEDDEDEDEEEEESDAEEAASAVISQKSTPAKSLAKGTPKQQDKKPKVETKEEESDEEEDEDESDEDEEEDEDDGEEADSSAVISDKSTPAKKQAKETPKPQVKTPKVEDKTPKLENKKVEIAEEDDEDMDDEDESLDDEDLSDEDLEDEDDDEDEEEELSPAQQKPGQQANKKQGVLEIVKQQQNSKASPKQKPEAGQKRTSSEVAGSAPAAKKANEPPTKKARFLPTFTVNADKNIVNEVNERTKQRDECTLFIKNLPKKVSEEDVKALSADIKVLRRKSENCRFGWISFASEQICAKNYEKLQGAKIGGTEIFIDFCGEKSKAKGDRVKQNSQLVIDPTELYVGNLPGPASVDELKKSFPTAVNFVIPKHKHVGDKKYAFVKFATVQSAREAFDKSKNLKINGANITVNYSKGKTMKAATDSGKN